MAKSPEFTNNVIHALPLYLDRINLPEAGKRDFQELRLGHLIGLSNRFEFTHIFSGEFLPDLFELGYGLR